MLPLQTKLYMLNHEEGQIIPSLGVLVSVKATGEQTGEAFNLFEVLCPVDYETPLHIHYIEDVAIFILEGALEVYWGNEKKMAPAGTYFFQPKGTPHGFRVEGNSTARIIYLTIPAGFDRFVSECARSSEHYGMISAARYKIEILGPLPGIENKLEDQND